MLQEIFLILLAFCFIILILGLVYENALFGATAGVLFILLSGITFVEGIDFISGKSVEKIEPCNCTEDARTLELIKNITTTEHNTYTTYKNNYLGLILALLGLYCILGGVQRFKED